MISFETKMNDPWSLKAEVHNVVVTTGVIVVTGAVVDAVGLMEAVTLVVVARDEPTMTATSGGGTSLMVEAVSELLTVVCVVGLTLS